MSVNDPASVENDEQAAAELARLGEEFFEVAHTADPFGATQVGASGFDALVPDPRPSSSSDCIIEEIDPVEAGNAPLAYYRPPAAGGLRPGAHCVLTTEPMQRYVYGWSRSQAMDFMWRNTATTRANVRNEIDRYIGWPGQALAYMVGRREIQRLRGQAERQLGAGFDIRAFHGTVLGNGAVPLGVPEQLVAGWAEQQPA
jgi:Bacterial protein of unknown function (DUF885)